VVWGWGGNFNHSLMGWFVKELAFPFKNARGAKKRVNYGSIGKEIEQKPIH